MVVTLNGSTNATVTVGGLAEDTIKNLENIIGGSAADTLIGDLLANILNGGGGADLMRGMAGNDTYVVDNAGDVGRRRRRGQRWNGYRPFVDYLQPCAMQFTPKATSRT